MDIFEAQKGEYLISTDPSKLQIDVIHGFLSNRSYWAQGRSIELVRKSLEHSLGFGLYKSGEQVGFARIVTDYATFAWLCDVFIHETQRGEGLGKWLIQTVINHPDLREIKRILLVTQDAHDLYRRYGEFKVIQDPNRMMERLKITPKSI